jgi:hypothetical protein
MVLTLVLSPTKLLSLHSTESPLFINNRAKLHKLKNGKFAILIYLIQRNPGKPERNMFKIGDTYTGNSLALQQWMGSSKHATRANKCNFT